MASSGSSASVPREVVDDLLGLRESGAMLQTMFEGSSSTPPSAAAGRELLDGMMTRVTSALSVLNIGGGGASSSSVGRRNRAGAAVAGPHRRRSSSSSRRRC
jgi:hypothetical protein